MVPMRTSSIFKSRWMALIWAAGIIWLALDVAGALLALGGMAGALSRSRSPVASPDAA